MKHLFFLLLTILVLPATAMAANTGNSSGHAWSESTGYISFSGENSSADYGVTVADYELTGYAWSEATGYISMNCSNENSCGTVDYKVVNDADGNLSGHAWSELLGWISFSGTEYAVTIDNNGDFSGYAWSESIGYISFSGTEYGVSTLWSPTLPKLTTQAVTGVADLIATGNGEITSIGADTPTRFIEWGTTEGGPYTGSCSAGSGGVGLYTCKMTGLQAETMYYVRAGATNTEGTNYGDEVTFTTLELQDIVIPDPDTTKVSSAVSDGYISVDNGTIDNTTQATTQVEVTLQSSVAEAVFPAATQISEVSDGNFDFQGFAIADVDVSSQQSDSRVAIDLGVAGEQMSFSQDVTITVNVGGAYNDQEMDILYQNDGESSWNPHDTCTVVGGECTFTTDHATIYTINGLLQATGDAPININTEVQDTLTLDCYDAAAGTGDYDVAIGTATDPGKVTAGNPAVGRSTCDVTTNDDQGYYLTIIDDNAAVNTVLTHDDPNTATTYEIADLVQYSFASPNTQNWSAPTTKGLGFSVVSFPDTNLLNNELDGVWTATGLCPEGAAADTNNYAGIPDTAETIAAVTQYEANRTTTNICYKVDVPASQASGVYTGSVTYTATSDASSYLN